MEGLSSYKCFYLAIHNMFRPREAIIRRFLRKYTNGDGLHINYTPSVKHFLLFTSATINIVSKVNLSLYLIR
jgi:hypothetical protein